MHLNPFLLANQCKYLRLANSMKACPGGTRTSPCFSALGFHTSSTLRGFFEFWSLLATMKKLLNKYALAIWVPPQTMDSLEQRTIFFLANQCKYLHPANSMKECLGVTGTLASARFLESPLRLRIVLPPPKCALCGLGEGVPGAPWGALPKVVLKLRADPEREMGCWPWPPPPLTPRLSFICKLRDNTI